MTPTSPMHACRRLSVLCALAALATGGAAHAQTPPAQAPPVAVAQPPSEADARIPLRLALQFEGAFGVGSGSFQNGLLGGRLDLRFSPHISLGGYLGYANLKGKEGRAHSALTYAQLEYLTGQSGDRLRVPARFASGYLGGNGPIVRAATGLAFALGPTVDLVLEVASLVWFTNNQTLLSLGAALELGFKL